MNLIKKKVISSTGKGFILAGGIGAVVSAFGLCPCVLAPIFSLVGIASFVGVFLSKNKILFIVIGSIFLLISLILSKKNKLCLNKEVIKNLKNIKKGTKKD